MIDDAPENKRLARSERLEAVIKRLRPVVNSEGRNGIKITKTDSMWVFETEDFKSRLDAIEQRLNTATATAQCNEDGTITITITI